MTETNEMNRLNMMSTAKRLQPTWKKEPSLADLKNDYDAAKADHDVVKAKILKREQLIAGGAKVVTKKANASKMRPLLIRKVNEWKYGELEEPFLSATNMFRFSPRTEEDVESAQWNETYINYQWETLINKVKFVNDVSRTITDLATVVVKVGWEAEYGTKIVEEEVPTYYTPEESIQMIQQQVQAGELDPARAQAMIEMGEPLQSGTKKAYTQKETLVKNQPKYEVCNLKNVIIDPTCDGDMSNAMFVIHEFQTSLSELKKNEFKQIKKMIKVVQADGSEVEVEKVEEFGFYHDIDKISDSTVEEFKDYKNENNSPSFNFKDKARKKITAYEYWGYMDINNNGNVVPIVATWVGDTLIRLEENPYAHKKIPFVSASYMPKTGSVHGEANADLLADNQEVYGKLTRATLDIIGSKAAGQRFINNKITKDAIAKSNLENGLDVIYNADIRPQDAVFVQNIEPPSPMIYQLMQKEQQDAESMSGVMLFNSGINGEHLGSTAQSVRSTMTSSSRRNLSILRRLNKMYEEIARMTIAMNQAYLKDEEIVRLTNGEHVTIRRDDLQGNFDIVVEVSTAEADEEKAKELSFMLQTMGNTANPKTVNKILAKIARLRKMPDLEADIMDDAEEESKPDPVQQQLQQIQLENALLQNYKLKKEMEESDSRILERLSRIEENKEGDEEIKKAKALKEKAQAEKIMSERDRLDIDFVEKATGADTEKDMIKKEHEKDIDKLAKENEVLKQMLNEIRNRMGGSDEQK